MVMTITSNPIVPRIDEYDDDQRPGSSDVAWAERAYRREDKEPANERRRVPRSFRRRLRVLLAIFILVLAMSGLVLVMRYSGAASSPVTNHPTSSQPVTVPHPTAGTTSLSSTAPLLRVFPSLPPTFITPRR
jgi:hypothetical protein